MRPVDGPEEAPNPLLAHQIELAVMVEQTKGRFMHPRDVAEVAVAVMKQWGCPNCPDPLAEQSLCGECGGDLETRCATCGVRHGGPSHA